MPLQHRKEAICNLRLFGSTARNTLLQAFFLLRVTEATGYTRSPSLVRDVEIGCFGGCEPGVKTTSSFIG